MRFEWNSKKNGADLGDFDQAGRIATPYIDHAKSYMDRKPSLPPPVYAPETVAEAILHAAENPVRDMFVGSGGKGHVGDGSLCARVWLTSTWKRCCSSSRSAMNRKQPRHDGLYESDKRSTRTRALSGACHGDELLHRRPRCIRVMTGR